MNSVPHSGAKPGSVSGPVRLGLEVIAVVVVAAFLGVAYNARSDGLPLIPRSAPPLSPSAGSLELPKLELHQLLDAMEQGALVVDARWPEEYFEGHIPGAVNVPVEAQDATFWEAYDQLPPDIPLILYCNGPDCDLAELLSELLLGDGYQELSLFPGGWEVWYESELPIAEGPGAGSAEGLTR